MGGRIYERVRVLETTPGTVTIAHAAGISQLDLATLPEALQKRFNYDPSRAEAWRQQANTHLRETEQLKDRATVEKFRRARLEELREASHSNSETEEPSAELRPEVDLRPIFIENNLYLKYQGPRPSCAIFAIISALEFEYAVRYGRNEPLCEEFLIWAFSKEHPDAPIDDGYHFAEILETLGKYGVASRMALPDSFATYRTGEPSDAALEEAATRRRVQVAVVSYAGDEAPHRIAGVLNKNVPVIIGLRWPRNSVFAHNNLLHAQKPVEDSAHAIMIVGYRTESADGSLVFTFRNSYGPKWGLGGYGMVSAEYLRNNLLVAFALIVPHPGEER